ncbi:hypothetical protein ENBRE01_2208 [Enteropsectra breve]|nr:hypothetical protein ENBRE01_2208 [Enteropsectra breve]
MEHEGSTENKEPRVEDTEEYAEFDKLTYTEKDCLMSKLRDEILQIEGREEFICSAFFHWIKQQFAYMSYSPPSLVYTTAVDYLKENAEETGLFIEEGVPAKAEEYYDSLRLGVDIDYTAEDFDMISLSAAVLHFTKTKVEFLEPKIYKKLIEVYKNGDNREYAIVRVPYILLNRNIFISFIEMINTIKKDEQDPEIMEVFSDALIKGKDTPDDEDHELRTEILKDLITCDFENVPMSQFYK